MGSITFRLVNLKLVISQDIASFRKDSDLNRSYSHTQHGKAYSMSCKDKSIALNLARIPDNV